MAAPADKLKHLAESKLEDDEFLTLLKDVIGLTEQLQNNPPALNPKEELVADVVVKYLAPYSGDNGPLSVRKLTYRPNRSNVIITYKGTDPKKVISFVGSHMDVVPANPEEWKRNPFQLVQEGDKLYGRGVTDCLGHVCVLTNFFKQLAIRKPVLTNTVVGVFIANEEASAEEGVGIDELVKQKELDHLRHGPLFWVDSANFGPTMGTAGMLTWQLTVNGKKFHSGVPQNGINSIHLAMEVVKYLEERFYHDFTSFAEEEKRYKFAVGSSLKPTQISTPPGSLNQIPGQCTVSGDIRLTPFYNTTDTKAKVEKYMAELDVTSLVTRGASRFHLTDDNQKGVVELKWLGSAYEGVATKLDSPGFKALHDAIAKVRGEAKPFSLTGSLPIIRDLQNEGFDVQITGFGRMEAYHANDEFAYLDEFRQGFRIVSEVIAALDQ